MIKLLKILSEIKIIGNITSEIVEDLYVEIANYLIDNDKNLYDLYDIAKKYGVAYNQFNILIPINYDKKELNKFYQDLKNFKKQFDVSEIKVNPKVTIKSLLDLREKVLNKVWDNENKNLLNRYKLINYKINGKRLERIPQEELINIYNEFLKLYKEIK